jgi:hypothetical protein
VFFLTTHAQLYNNTHWLATNSPSVGLENLWPCPVCDQSVTNLCAVCDLCVTSLRPIRAEPRSVTSLWPVCDKSVTNLW